MTPKSSDNLESESGRAPILKQSRVCGRSVIFSLCNLDTGMTNTITFLHSPVGILSCRPDTSKACCTCCASPRSKSRYAYVRGALTLNQSKTDKSKHTNLKSVFTFSGQYCLKCVFRLLTCLILHFSLGACYGLPG